MAGLLDMIDPEELRRMQAAFAPSAEERKSAQIRGLLGFGLGALAAPRRAPMAGIANAAYNGMAMYDDSLSGAARARQQSLGTYAQMMQLAQQAQAMKERQALGQAHAQSLFPSNAPDAYGPPTPDEVGARPKELDPQAYIRNLQAAGPAGVDRAMAIQQAQAKESPWAKINPSEYEPASLVKFSRSKDPADLVPYRKPDKPDNPAGKANPSDFTPASFAKFMQGGGTDYSVLVPIDKRPQTNVNVNTAPKAFWQDFGGEQAKVLVAAHKTATQASEALAAINQAREVAANGAYQGGFADWKMNTANALKGLGFSVDDKTLANTTALKSALGKFLLDHAKALGSNPSNADAARIDKIIGTIDTDPGGLAKVLDFMDSQARKSVQTFNKQYKQAMSQPNAFAAYDMTVPEPPPFKGSPSGTPADIDAILKKYSR